MRKPPPRLAAEWAEKLRASGFHDIETPDGRLLESDEQHQADAEASWNDRAASERYYDLARRFIHSPRFGRLTPARRRIWALHADGRSNTGIAREVGVSVKAVRHCVKVCRRMAGLPEVASQLGHGRRADPVE